MPSICESFKQRVQFCGYDDWPCLPGNRLICPANAEKSGHPLAGYFIFKGVCVRPGRPKRWWLKLDADLVCDLKVQALSDKEFRVMILAFCYALKEDRGGYLPPHWTDRVVSQLARTSVGVASACRLRLVSLNILSEDEMGLKVTNFQKHQYVSEQFPTDNQSKMQRKSIENTSPEKRRGEKNREEKRREDLNTLQKAKETAPLTQREPEIVSTPIWIAYRDAYKTRYGEEPPRNLDANRNCKKLLGKLGMENAVAVAAFYVTHNDAWYVKMGHALDYCAKNAEKLLMEMKTGRKITATAANQSDLAAYNRDNMRAYLEREKIDGQ